MSHILIFGLDPKTEHRNRHKVNCENRAARFLTDVICLKQENAMKSTIAILENGTFYSLSHDYNKAIKRQEFNEVLYKVKR